VLSRTETGIVTAIVGSHITIRILGGSPVRVKVLSTHLKLGDYCNVAFNLTTGKIASIMEKDHSPVDSDIIPSDNYLSVTEDELECYE